MGKVLRNESIYIAALVNTPQNNLDFKILYLDDIFIGLDMSNRLPLLDILKNFKKPIIEQFVDAENDNAIVERVQRVGGEVQTEPESFFKTYQIFISTYDRFWFQVAKNWFENYEDFSRTAISSFFMYIIKRSTKSQFKT